MKRKKPYTFTLNEDLMEWFKFYAKEEDRSMSNTTIQLSFGK